jgi:acylphosphatase
MACGVLFTVHGKVQGVGYRYLVLVMAKRHRINGIVRNVSDGSVEIFAIGNADSIDAFAKGIDVDLQGGADVMRIERGDIGGSELSKLGLDAEYMGFRIGKTRQA